MVAPDSDGKRSSTTAKLGPSTDRIQRNVRLALLYELDLETLGVRNESPYATSYYQKQEDISRDVSRRGASGRKGLKVVPRISGYQVASDMMGECLVAQEDLGEWSDPSFAMLPHAPAFAESNLSGRSCREAYRRK